MSQSTPGAVRRIACASREGRERPDMLKITIQRDVAPDTCSLLLEGRLAGPWVEELNSYWCQMFVDQTESHGDRLGRCDIHRCQRQAAVDRAVATRCRTSCVRLFDQVYRRRVYENGPRTLLFSLMGLVPGILPLMPVRDLVDIDLKQIESPLL
jgi:hypothetical protein